MSSKPHISVLMPVYNCELYVREAIDSILNQTFTDFEFLIIDDASTDTTVEIIRSYNDFRIQLIVKPLNTGYTNSLNQGLKLAKGKYIARMDGDDISYPERFAKQITYLDANTEVVLCATGYKIIGIDSELSFPENHDTIKLALLKGNCISHPSVMMRKETLDEHLLIYDSTKEPAEDYALWIRLLFVGKLHILPEVLLEYRMYANQVSHRRAVEQKKIDIEMKFKLLSYLDLVIEPMDKVFLEKYYREIEVIAFIELKVFKQLQKKLRLSNNNSFFEPKAFNDYLTIFEASVLRRYFKNYKRYSPILYVKYLIAKWRWDLGLNANQEFKLLIKCILFSKIL
jgi:glycosyltransferase involved in cell wall biosynthesis